MPVNAPVNESTARQMEFAFRAAYAGTQNDGTDGSPRGHRFLGLMPNEDVLFSALAITDTTAHDSNASVTIYAQQKTILVVNGLNQSVSIQAQWSRDGSSWYNLGTAQSVTAGAAAEIGTSTISALGDYLPMLRVTATCATAPTSGSLSAWLERLG